MSKFLAKSGLKWMHPKDADLDKFSTNISENCILEIDLEYPKNKPE